MFRFRCTLFASAAFVLLAAGVVRAQQDSPKPTFEKSRPKGPRQMLAPLPKEKPPVPSIRFGNFKPINPIDNFILAKIQENKARPKPLCDDWDYARRASLDLVGVIPTAADLDRYLAWPVKERRAKWVDFLLEQQQYADHWTTLWGDLLREQGRIQGVPANSLKRFVHDSLLNNKPYDRWVRELITAKGRPVDNPATAFVLRDRVDPAALTVTITQTFMGLQVKCAQCHDHPFDWWEEKDFKGMEAFWAGTRQRVYDRQERFARGRVIETPLFEVESNEARARGVFLTGATSPQGRGTAGLADLLTRSDNPYFARVVVNRLWHKMMGLGLVNPVDNFSALNPPSHPELLDWLALELIEHQCDLKHILRLIANSRSYQQTSVEQTRRIRLVRAAGKEGGAGEGYADNALPGSLFDGMPLRAMTAEQIQDSILVATGRYLTGGRRFEPSIEVTYPPDPRSFLRVFGCPDRDTLLPRNPLGSIQQALTLLNGNLLNDAIRLHEDHPIREWQKQKRWTRDQIVDALFVQILTRPPTPEERAMAIQFVGGGGKEAAWEDLQWALFNTREFLFIR